ncbi:hypothetical protein [Haliangium ochraceum]|uniref:Uncharacterized protein n=1 Tax=Haliangium ochraceum (strain DSM 14365 / JCM 11303 / SMP-2) TaxID=502025 RepID=D0LNK6_HALO1|nr:hypothetical protein [Haliangium ochraceum]ACY16911.1 hypothetical protein Hoch_4417 [Haliangium ochraceum DSM 14365]
MVSAPSVSPATATDTSAGSLVNYTISDLDDSMAYRVTLVVGANVTADGASGVFVDGDGNGAADAGASENVALITKVNGQSIDGVKTYPAGSDDPANPSGIFPSGGQITVEVLAVADGTIYPVAYENGGATTFLEIGSDGAPIENYAVGGALNVSGASGQPRFAQQTEQTAGVGTSTEYTIVGVSADQAYRVTLVVADNVTVDGDRGTFVDNDENGAADAGASETIALITQVNGDDIEAAKTFPAGTDDPQNPSGIVPKDGKITVTVTGVAAGKVFPVAYVNGGNSTFLEIGSDGRPVAGENYAVGGAFTVE